MIIMGLIGYFFNRIQIPITPIVLGLVLGDTLESNYRTAMSLSSGDIGIFFSSVTTLLFFSLIVLTIALQVKTRVLDIKKQKKLAQKGES